MGSSQKELIVSYSVDWETERGFICRMGIKPPCGRIRTLVGGVWKTRGNPPGEVSNKPNSYYWQHEATFIIPCGDVPPQSA